MENTKYYDQLKTPPDWALKKIVGGTLKGKTDISPQWRYQKMTEVFGPIGIGWYYEIDKQWTERGHGDVVMCFCNISLYVKHNDEWSKPIHGTGGNELVSQSKSGLYNSDEGYKMALTDALSVAMKLLGVAADVYNGFSDSKYSDTTPKPQANQSNEPEKPWFTPISKDGELQEAGVKWMQYADKVGKETATKDAEKKYRISKKVREWMQTV